MSCVPCPCDAFGVTGRIQCPILTNLMAQPPRLGQLYATTISVFEALPKLTAGVEENLQSAVTPWFMKIGIALTLPWLIIMFIILYILQRSSIISYDLMIICILCALFLVSCALAYLYTVVTPIVNNGLEKVLTPISENWEKYKSEIVPDIISSYIGCEYCSSSTFGCTSSCGGICGATC